MMMLISPLAMLISPRSDCGTVQPSPDSNSSLKMTSPNSAFICGVGDTSTVGEISIVDVGGNHSTVGDEVGVIVWLAVGTGDGAEKGKQADSGIRRRIIQILFIKRQRWITCERSGPTEIILTGTFSKSSILEI